MGPPNPTSTASGENASATESRRDSPPSIKRAAGRDHGLMDDVLSLPCVWAAVGGQIEQ